MASRQEHIQTAERLMESVEKFCERNPHTVSSAFITALQLDIQRAGVHAQLASLKETT